jgi:5-hydroxyisourate hydrolase
MARISSHVLDLAHGRPAEGIRIEFEWLGQTTTHRTNADGRTDQPILVAESIPAGIYELVFHVGDYLREQGAGPEPLFLDRIAIRFGVSNPMGNYHIPLLLSPYGYSTYRGS